MPYLRNCYFPNTPRSNENAANEIAYGAAVCIEEIKERGMEDGYGLSLIVDRSDSKHQFILTIEACKTEHQHEMAQDAETVAEHWVSPMKLRFLEVDGQDALEEWCEGVVAGLREDADDSGREDNPRADSMRDRCNQLYPQRHRRIMHHKTKTSTLPSLLMGGGAGLVVGYLLGKRK
jgi:hypothetical protein